MSNSINFDYFYFDGISQVMILLVIFISLTITSFAIRYLKGDTQVKQFFILLALLTLSVTMLVCADHIVLFLTTWGISNLLLVKLMIHKSNWHAAKAAGLLAAKNFGFGFLLLTSALIVLYVDTGQTSIQAMLHTKGMFSNWAAILLLITAMTQSAIWPFHRWLLSSLNSPTPVSAIMHAGLINGGGFLLVRFAPLFFNKPFLLLVIFIFGLITALLGTLWKLIQHDVKRMLACSTLGQMGFMLVQCGLGLFPAAIAHLCWHGLFKAYLFLASADCANEDRIKLNYPPSALSFSCALICGILASRIFAVISHKPWLAMDTTMVLIAIAFISASQAALTLLSPNPIKRFPMALLVTSLLAGLYGFTVNLIEQSFEASNLFHPQRLNGIYLFGLFLLFLVWLAMLFLYHRKAFFPTWVTKWYVRALNSSQPHPSTIVCHRNHYQY